VALIALDAAIRKGGGRRYVLAALAIALLALTNVTGAVGFAMMLAAYFLSKPLGEWPQAALRTAGAGLLAYGLAAPWIPPSTLLLISTNSRRSAGNYYPFTPSHILYLAAIALALAGLYALFERWNLSRYLRFALFLTFLAGVVALPAFLLKIYILPQPERFQLEFELGVCLVLAALLARMRRAPAAILSALCLIALVYHRRNADELIQPVDIRATTEYKEARWFGEHMRGRRVFAPGSVSFWMNIWNDTPQLGGCCDQGTPHWQQRVALYVIYIAENAGARDAEISLAWLTAYGVHAIGVSGPGSGEWYKPFTNPRKFDGVLKELWRESDRVTRGPVHGLDIDPMRAFVAALNDPSRPLAAMEWQSRGRARIEADLNADDLVSVQVMHHHGWRAEVNGVDRPIESDALGLMVIRPDCSGRCAIDLIYDGGAEMKIARAAQWFSAALCLALLLRRRGRGFDYATRVGKMKILIR
jgi:hypothetical protein